MIFNKNTYYFIPHCHWCQLRAPHIIGSRTRDTPRHLAPLRGASMAYLPLRTVGLPEASDRFFDGWLEQIGGRLAGRGADWYRIPRDVLFELWSPGLPDYDPLVAAPATPAGTRAALLALDPHNVTL